MTAIAVERVSLEQYRAIDAKVDGAEHDGLRARWEFGRLLLRERVGKKLPKDRLEEVARAIGKSETEVRYRMLFASRCPDETSFVSTADEYGSWHAVLDSFDHNHRAQGTGENEWYTPAQYIDLARTVMGGIDLDPASSDIAQATVRATTYFTAADDGLAKPWWGRVWLNPPYTQPLIEQFVRKLVSEVESGRVTEAILLTHNYTDTAWFQYAAWAGCTLCFTKGRVRFVNAAGDQASPTQGQTFFYFGPNRGEFVEHFEPVGLILQWPG